MERFAVKNRQSQKQKIGFIKRVDKGRITTVKADYSSISPSSERNDKGLTLKKSAF